MIIDKEFQNLIPALMQEEYNQLEENLLQNGIREPLSVWGDLLIDGHNRYDIAQKHNLPYTTKSYEFDSRNDVIFWIIKNQFGRRNISNYDRALLAIRLKPVIAEKAKEQQIRKPESFVKQKSAEQKPIETRSELAKMAHVSHDTITRVEKIEEKATPKIKEMVKTGEISINQAYQEVRREEKAAEKAVVVEAIKEKAVHDGNFINGDSLVEMTKLDDGSIDCVITDPPYGIDYISNYRVIDNNVDRAVENDTKEKAFELWDNTCKILYDKMAEDSHLYCFTSWKVYPEFKAITAKYFNIKNCLIWEKNNWSMGDLDGNYAEQYEMILYATKGNKKLNGRRDTNILKFDRVSNHQLLHSCEKPIDLIEFLIDKSTVKGDMVADPFAGSGAILKACKNTNRQYWGCEYDKETYSVALGRLSSGD